MMSLVEPEARSRCRPFSGDNGTMTNSLHGGCLMLTNIRVIKSSGYDLAWTRIGRRRAMKPDELSRGWSTVPISSLTASRGTR
jgi:hypothetical protein